MVDVVDRRIFVLDDVLDRDRVPIVVDQILKSVNFGCFLFFRGVPALSSCLSYLCVLLSVLLSHVGAICVLACVGGVDPHYIFVVYVIVILALIFFIAIHTVDAIWHFVVIVYHLALQIVVLEGFWRNGGRNSYHADLRFTDAFQLYFI